MYYYLDQKGNQIGPVSKEGLRNAGITRTTLIYRQGWPTWIPADKIPELADVIGEIPPPPITTMKPPSYLWLGILTTILCCLPFGIISIVYASKVDSCWSTGLYNEAVANSNKARNWGIASAVIGPAIILLYVLMSGMLFASSRYHYLFDF